jgi:histidyl-tRNA synthetase
MQQLSVPKGTRDFSPAEMVKRNYIFDTIRKVYELFGFMPIETPAMENLSTLLGKYGDEGDKLLFRVLNSGDFFSGINPEEIKPTDASGLSSKISEKGLRYDLTVPFARYVVMNRNDLTFPFRRYQIQPVWRADKPQKGRYREFYQCDADVIGSNSLLNELELIQIIDTVFQKIKVNVVIKINNRKILAGIAEIIGCPERITDITTAIDKIEKIGIEKVNDELIAKGLSKYAVDKLQPILKLKGSNDELIVSLQKILSASAVGMKGVEEMTTLVNYVKLISCKAKVEIDLTLARGLNYYTGTIIEVKAADVQIGSICGGGRYDDLTGIFGMEGVSGVGISFGADRIYDVLTQLNGFPATAEQSVKVMFVNFGPDEEKYCIELATKLRAANVRCIIYPDQSKMKKQMAYADSLKIPYVAIIGGDELKEKSVALKNMTSGEQVKVNEFELLNYKF